MRNLSSYFLRYFFMLKIRNFKVRFLFNTVNNSHITYWFKTNTYTSIGSGMLLATCNALYIAISQSFKTWKKHKRHMIQDKKFYVFKLNAFWSSTGFLSLRYPFFLFDAYNHSSESWQNILIYNNTGNKHIQVHS